MLSRLGAPMLTPRTLRKRAADLADLLWQRGSVAIVFTVFVLLRSVDRVFFKRVNDRLANYQLFFAALLFPIGIQIVQTMLTVGYVLYFRFYVGDSRYTMWNFMRWRSPLACCRGAFPQSILFYQSVIGQVGNAVTALPTAFLNITTVGLLLNFGVITTAFFARTYLGSKFKACHYLGCALIIASSLVAINRELATATLGEYVDADGHLQQASGLWYVIFLVGVVPMGFSNVYNQKYLQEDDLDIVYASFWGGIWQIVAGVMFFPVNWIPLPAPATSRAPGDTLEYLWNGCLCTMGVAPSSHPMDLVCEAKGGSPAVWFGVYLLCTMSFNVLLNWLTKYMSATWANIGSVLCLDLSAILSMSPLLMGSEARPVTLEQYLALVLAALAMAVYTLEPERPADAKVPLPVHTVPSEIGDIEQRISAVARARADSRALSDTSKDPLAPARKPALGEHLLAA